MTIKQLWHIILEGVFPPQCGACDRIGCSPFCGVCSHSLEDAGPCIVPGYDFVLARFEYGGSIAKAIQALKFSGRVDLGRTLGALLAEQWPSQHKPDIMVPAPASFEGLMNRGYNPARELCRGFSFPLKTMAVTRSQIRPPQVGLSREARLHNQKDAFKVDSKAVQGRTVMVVDDVLTTGATLEALRTAIMKAGARRCIAAVLARTEA